MALVSLSMQLGHVVAAVVLVLALAGSAEAQDRTCWCVDWVHGPDSGESCFYTPPACQRARRGYRERAALPCRRETRFECERTGVVHGRASSRGPTRPGAARLLTQTRAFVERELGASSGRDADWVEYGPRLAVQFQGDRVARVRVHMAPQATCQAAATREGFDDAGAPPSDTDGCEWGDDSEHRLDPEAQVAGRFDRERSTLEVWIVRDAR